MELKKVLSLLLMLCMTLILLPAAALAGNNDGRVSIFFARDQEGVKVKMLGSAYYPNPDAQADDLRGVDSWELVYFDDSSLENGNLSLEVYEQDYVFSVNVSLSFDTQTKQLRITGASLLYNPDNVRVSIDVNTTDCIQYYTVDVAESAYGSVATYDGSRYYLEDDEVFLEVEPEENFTLDSLSIVKADGTVIPTGENGEYCFRMPASDVTVTAGFLPELSEVPIVISTALEWEAAVKMINDGSRSNMNYQLSESFDNSSYPLTAPIGTEEHPFTGTFDGKGKMLNVDITDTANEGTAPFRYIAGATIQNLTVTGSVNGARHAAGLVGFNLDGSSTIENCVMKTSIVVASESDEDGTYQYIGGVVGHSTGTKLTLRNVVFDGTICNDFLGYVGGLVGWNEDSTLTFDNCLFHASYEGYADFHPVACKKEGGSGKASGADTVYSTQEAALTGGTNSPNYVTGSSKFELVETVLPSDDLYQTVHVLDYTAYIPAGVTISGLNESYTPSTASTALSSYVLKDAKGSELTEGTDYTVTVSPDDNVTEEGTYTLTFTGAGIYSGSKTFTFEVRSVTEENPITDTLTRETTGVPAGSSTYTDWSCTGVSGAVYAGQSAGGNNAIQIRTKNNNSGIVTTASGGAVSRVNVEWNNLNNQGATPSTLYIYGKNTAYTLPADLYNSEEQGTLLGEIVYNGNSSGELTIDGDYPYIGLRSASGAMYLNKIMIDWRAPKPAFKVQSLRLAGKIGVNFFLDLSSLTDEQKTDSYMTFDVGTTVTGRRVDYDSGFMNSTDEYYGFTCFVNALQMADTITATYHYTEDGAEKTVQKDYSVERYITARVGNSAASEKEKDLIKALKDYGYYAQQYLSGLRGWTLGEKYAAMTAPYAASYDIGSMTDPLAAYKVVKNLVSADVEKVTFALALDSNTSIYLYVKPQDGYSGSVGATVNGSPAATVTTSDGRYRITIPGISAHKLGDTYEVKITTGNGVSTVKISAMSYVYACLTNPNSTEKEKNCAAALGSYFAAADAFKKAANS